MDVEKIISHKYFIYIKYLGLLIILAECIKTGSVFFGHLQFVGTAEEWRFVLVRYSFIIKLSLFVSALLAFIIGPVYVKSKQNGSLLSEK